MHTINRSFALAAAAVFAASATLGMHAQQPAAVSPTLNLQAALKTPFNFMDVNSSSSSTSSDSADTVTTERSSLSDDSSQPPPRRRYGRPRYTDGSHNADGSNKYTFQVGGGFTLPTGGTHDYFKTSYDFQAGGGRNFNKNVGLLIDFNWANFGIQTNTLNNQLDLYNGLCTAAEEAAGDCSLLTQLGGSGHVWSFALDPIYNFAQGDKTGAYVTGGVGFYHKTTTFTTPTTGEYCDYYGYCYEYQANQPIDSYTSNAFGVNAGLGYTYKPSQFANEKFFVEARYIYTANSRRAETGTTTANTPSGSTAFNAFPQNSAPTTFIPITFGVRF
ncbi:outer membrane beta-barrel protein [Granulicella arctica]|uniref:Outer membrane protein beta-barrel domain-containing protein n=1 Tax=Granulicella arctica TaxID=940613 RepID=A0A7Y9TIA6_9BACT|nr:outer membrane beta-barrel protein [Granulicella arctica]NYF81384.1 hypothetical protein [Granulicella arctica]